jgi:manganese/zinc/iron transport system permease protein
LFSPRYGVATRAFRRWRQRQRTQSENGLKSVFLALDRERAEQGVGFDRLASSRQETRAQTRRMAQGLARHGWADISADTVKLTPVGMARARELDRNYRLWEQFLTDEVHLPFDHTQRDAENIEHILGPDLVRELEARLEQRHE